MTDPEVPATPAGGVPAQRRRLTEVMTEQGRVTPLELFFDLVFVYAFTQVTAIMADDLSAHGVLRGLLLLAVLWWVWCCYAWVGTTLRADAGLVRAVLLAVMVAMFIAALAIPEAFTDRPGGLPGPIVFAGCYLFIRAMHLLTYWLGARAFGSDGAAMVRQLPRIAVPMLIGSGLVFAASFTSGTAQLLLWAVALLVDYGGVLLAGTSGWVVPAPGHFAERHGLIVIIALGESIVASGLGVRGLPISWPIVVAAALGIVIAAALWWLYFDVVAIAAEHRFASLSGAARSALARDSYTFLHLPMVAGIILLSLGLKKVLGIVDDPGYPLKGMGLYVLYGGVVLYLLGHVGFRLRNMGSVNPVRVGAVVVIAGLIPIVHGQPALVALGGLAAVSVLAVLVEVWRYAGPRAALRGRAGGQAGQPATEGAADAGASDAAERRTPRTSR